MFIVRESCDTALRRSARCRINLTESPRNTATHRTPLECNNQMVLDAINMSLLRSEE